MSKKKKPITIDDLWSMKRFGAASLSPDGRRACVAVSSYSMAGNDSSSQLWLLATDGSTQRQLTRGQKDSDPQWSPDGRWIAFTARRNKSDGSALEDEAQLYLIAADGGEATRVTDLATGVSALRWFPDSKGLAFISWVWPEEKTVKAQARRAQAERDDKVKAYVIEENHYRYWDHWFLRGRRAHVHLVTLSMDDLAAGASPEADVRDLFAGTAFQLPPQDPDASFFDISPDGDEIAFTHDFDPDPRAPAYTDIVLMDVKKGRWHSPTRTSGRSEETPRYSPDGRWIAMLSSNLAKAHNEQARLALIRRSDDAFVPLTFEWDRGIHGPAAWSRDSARLYFLAETEVAQPIWTLAVPRPDAAASGSAPATTRTQTQPSELLRGPHNGGIATDLSVGADGATLIYTRSSQMHPPSLFVSDAEGASERAIERFNAATLERIVLADARSVTIAGANQDPVQMWVLTPPDFSDDGADDDAHDDATDHAADAPPKKQKQWPLMHTIHGGPHTCSNDGWHWRWNMQLFAAQGYVVASVNYHGSTGWGQQFLGSITGDWGVRELADIEAGTEFLLTTGRIDPKRVVAAGGSYGGYMVALMNGRARRGRYAAYICHAGCYDWVSMMGSDGAFWFAQELGAFHWDDEARVLAQSPHHYAQHFDTPTLVMHGELDYRVPYYQGLAYYNTLRILKVPSRLVFFPDENHWILKPQNSKLWYHEFFAWLERFAGEKKAKHKKVAGKKPH